MNPDPAFFLICDPAHPHSPALALAGSWAQAAGARIHLCLFDHSEAIAMVGLVDAAGMERARDGFLLERRATAQGLANELKAKGLRATADVAWARPAHLEMLRQIEELQPRLVIKDAHHEPRLKRVLFTPTDWHLLRGCPVPLLLVSAEAPSLPRRIVAAVDPGPYEPEAAALSDRIIQSARAWAEQSGAELHLAFALDTAMQLAASMAGSAAAFSYEAYHAIAQMRTQAFESLANAHSIPADRRHLLLGPPGPAIADFASEQQADLIVLGTVHRSRLDRFVMGSTAERILERAPCSVLAVPPGPSAPLPKL